MPECRRFQSLYITSQSAEPNLTFAWLHCVIQALTYNTAHSRASSKKFDPVKQIFVEHFDEFQRRGKKPVPQVPGFVLSEINDYLSCGELGAGFIRNYCDSCKTDQLVAFSCKRRGFCPSCTSRRMHDTAHHLVTNVMPAVATRQWVLSVPFFLRYLMAYSPSLISQVLRIYISTISSWYKKNTLKHMAIKGKSTGAVTSVQRFGGALNLNVHLHTIFLDGCYIQGQQKSVWIKCPPPSSQDLACILAKLEKKIAKLLIKKGFVEGDEDESQHLDFKDASFKSILQSSVTYRLASGPRAGQKIELFAQNKVLANHKTKLQSKKSVTHNGYNLHAKLALRAHKRRRLEKLCRYISRGPLSVNRVRVVAKDRVAYELKQPWRDGTTHVLFRPIELIEKLTSLVPPPRAHLIRYHGVLAPNAKLRGQVVPGKKAARRGQHETHRVRLKRSELLKKTFNVDVTSCSKCGGKLKEIAVIRDPFVAQKILKSLGLPAHVPVIKRTRPRGPPVSADVKPQGFTDELSQLPPNW